MLGSYFTKGIGAAGILHAMMREAGTILLATQSMLIGKSWGITAIRVSPDGKDEPYPLPTGQVTALYARHHGNHVLQTQITNHTRYHQPYRINMVQAADSAAHLDVVVTRDDRHIYLHIINRHFTDAARFRVDLSAFQISRKPLIQHVFTGFSNNKQPCGTDEHIYGCLTKVSTETKGKVLNLALPARSVSVSIISLK